MTFLQLIWRNVFRNSRTYGTYFFSSVFSVLVFFIFGLLAFHPQLQEALPASSDTLALLAQLGLKAAQVVIVILAFVFLLYSFSNFLKSRKRDLAIYQMLGIAPKDLRKMLQLENLLVGFLAIVTGLSLGLLFSKVFLLLMAFILHVDTGLNFYFPTMALLLTFGIFLVIFLLISFFMTRKVETATLTSLAKGEEKAPPYPKTSFFLSLLGILLLLSGYGCLYVFVKRNFTGAFLPLALLLGCVVLTIGATFLLLHQFFPRILLALKKSRKYQMGSPLLFVSNLLFQMKENATLYALLSLTATVALVGIGVTSSLGSYKLSDNVGPTFSYTFTKMSEEKTVLKEVETQVIKKIKAGGHDVLALDVPIQQFQNSIQNLENTASGSPLYWQNYPSLIKESDYNQLAAFHGMKILHVKDNELVTFPGSNRELTEIRDLSLNKRRATGNVTLKNQTYPLNLVRETYFFNVPLFAPAIVSDAFFAKVTEASLEAEPSDFSMFVVDFPAWSKDTHLSKSLDSYISQQQKILIEKSNRATVGAAEDFNFSARNEFDYTSKYQKWQQDRQANGLIMMIGILLGGVFFIFATSILSFRLFGQLARVKKYQHDLFLLGVPEKSRIHIILKEIAIMYFLPVLISALHFSIAFWGLSVLANQGFWDIYGKIMGLYLIFQLLFFGISARKYLKELALIS